MNTVPFVRSQEFLGVNAIIKGYLKIWLEEETSSGDGRVLGSLLLGGFDGVRRISFEAFGSGGRVAPNVSFRFEVSDGMVCAISI
jgi:hypothetical protein